MHRIAVTPYGRVNKSTRFLNSFPEGPIFWTIQLINIKISHRNRLYAPDGGCTTQVGGVTSTFQTREVRYVISQEKLCKDIGKGSPTDRYSIN